MNRYRYHKQQDPVDASVMRTMILLAFIRSKTGDMMKMRSDFVKHSYQQHA